MSTPAVVRYPPISRPYRYLLSAAPAPLVFLVGWVLRTYGPGLIAVSAIVGFASGILDLRYWPFDRHVRWLAAHVTERMNRDWGSVVTCRDDAEVWLREHPNRRDLATVSMLIMADRRPEARDLLDSLPPPDTAAKNFGRASLSASIAMAEGVVPNLVELDALAAQVEDGEPRLYAKAQLAQMRLNLACRGLIPLDDARRDVRRAGLHERLPIWMEAALLCATFPGVVFSLVMFGYGFATGWR